jgi:hypothetical protein
LITNKQATDKVIHDYKQTSNRGSDTQSQTSNGQSGTVSQTNKKTDKVIHNHKEISNRGSDTQSQTSKQKETRNWEEKEQVLSHEVQQSEDAQRKSNNDFLVGKAKE